MNSEVIEGIKKFDKIINRKVSSRYFRFSPFIDQALRWLPMIAVATSDITGIKTKNKSTKKLKIALSAALINIITWPIKHAVRRRRPGFLSNRKSFPSGHTSMSFAGAEILRRETKETSPDVSLAGYAVATGVAIVRIGRKKHWLSDVVAGAVIGLASAAICYYFLDKEN